MMRHWSFVITDTKYVLLTVLVLASASVFYSVTSDVIILIGSIVAMRGAILWSEKPKVYLTGLSAIHTQKRRLTLQRLTQGQLTDLNGWRLKTC